jgi:hypothetical protein
MSKAIKSDIDTTYKSTEGHLANTLSGLTLAGIRWERRGADHIAIWAGESERAAVGLLVRLSGLYVVDQSFDYLSQKSVYIVWTS